MEHSRKVVVTPFEAEIDQRKPEKIINKKKKTSERTIKVLKLVLKLAKINGYDDQGRIKSRNGDYLNESNIADLINNALSYGKVLHGEYEFIELLKEAGIDPDMINNENVRTKLLNLYSKSKIDADTAVRVNNIEPIKLEPPQKRELEEEIEADPPRKRKRVNYFDEIGWEVPR